MKITYFSNNSGGDWWLTDDDWKQLESAGWSVDWLPKPWLGCNAKEASIEVESEEVAIQLWSATLGMDPDEPGCPCCGQPHNFWKD